MLRASGWDSCAQGVKLKPLQIGRYIEATGLKAVIYLDAIDLERYSEIAVLKTLKKYCTL